MPYLFTCPHCQTQTLVDDEYSGQTGQCVMCGRPIEIPSFATGGPTSRPRDLRAVRWSVAAFLGVLILVSVGFTVIQYGSQTLRTMQENRLRGECIQNLEAIAAALNAYARDYGTYPPPTTLAADGTPMHSWRVLILPYLGHQSLYDQYQLDEPWNSWRNLEIVADIPPEYRAPAAINAMGTETYYSLLVGKGTLFPASGPLGPGQVVDDPAKTLLVVEVRMPQTPTSQWSEPGDLDVTSMPPTVGNELGGHHQGGATVATVDGRGHFLRADTDPDVLQALITPSGGEGLPDDVLD